VLVKAFDDVLIIRRGTGTPKESVSGKADLIIGLDEWGHVVNVEIEFAEYYFQDAETAREILKKANGRKRKPAVATVHIRLLEGLK